MKSTSLLLLALLPLIDGFCENKPDGAYEAGCKTFTLCKNGVATEVECHETNVYNPAKQQCDDPHNVAPPCGHLIDCTGLANGHHPDLDQGCHSYYTCEDGVFFGHNFCPAGLVFSPEVGVCDWESAVYPPCGTLPRPTTTAPPSDTRR